MTLFVTLRQGLSPVVNAEVTALVEAGSSSVSVTFVDNGAGTGSLEKNKVHLILDDFFLQ